MRTRSGKGKLSESATPAPQHHDSSLDTSSSGSSKTSRKLTRSSSTNSMHSQIFVASHDDIVAFYSKPVLTISGLSEDFLGRLEREDELRHRSSRPKSLYEQFQEIERESSSQNEDPSQNGNDHERPKRGNRGRPAKIQKQHPSPRKRRARPRKSLADVDEEDYMSRPQTPSVADADEDANPDNAEPSGEPSEAADQDQADDSPSPDDPDASPSHQLISETTGTYRSTATSAPIQPSPPREPRPKPIYQDEELEDDDLPPPFTNTPGTPSESEVDDDANRILRKRFDYMTDPQKFIAALTKHLPSERTSEVLYALAENTQAALKAWQDEYLAIDKRVAAHANNGPRKPVNGGRVPVDPKVFDDQKEADIYSYVYDARKPPGTQDPFSQRIGTDYVGGRELRHRRARDVTTEDLAQSEEDVGKRKRRAAQRFDGAADSGSRTRKRDHAGSETPEPPGPRKRGKVGSATKRQSVVPPRIREMRGESAMTTSASEDDDTYEGTPEPRGPGKRRGRPPGSKNLAQRKDAGIKKGPRGKKGAAAAQAAVNAANNEQNSTQTTFPSAPSAVTTAPPQQQPQQQQPFFVQGYSHAPHSNIPPVSAAPNARPAKQQIVSLISSVRQLLRHRVPLLPPKTRRATACQSMGTRVRIRQLNRLSKATRPLNQQRNKAALELSHQALTKDKARKPKHRPTTTTITFRRRLITITHPPPPITHQHKQHSQQSRQCTTGRSAMMAPAARHHLSMVICTTGSHRRVSLIAFVATFSGYEAGLSRDVAYE
ncbi:uncharacterized protein LTHEOB_11285 [Lasiodiplodia theobromae]|uniref:uncharacterized protein n=1 Tax=Lasiodiplodia theobromae TaxID=45133 RepID=UPI0015C3D6F1|nr:uncharacterized protein LTHEOB_11285 [Lasiodiplodia theobromae]KAF4537965.1 hypothetical protein LTHEOB_11285 [Lasiodiplodia theobromae]